MPYCFPQQMHHTSLRLAHFWVATSEAHAEHFCETTLVTLKSPVRHTELPKLSLATTEHGAGSSQNPADFGQLLAHMQVKGCKPYKAQAINPASD